jgi:hypothetical protein
MTLTNNTIENDVLFGAIDMNIYPLEDVPVHTPQQNEDNI